jgi:hypothetical protein
MGGNRVAPFLLTFWKRQRTILKKFLQLHELGTCFSFVTQRKIFGTIPPMVESDVSPPDITVVLFSAKVGAIQLFRLILQVVLYTSVLS